MTSVLQRKRAVIDAVTDGHRPVEASALDAVVQSLPERLAAADMRAAA